jgi:hypothetical protein
MMQWHHPLGHLQKRRLQALLRHRWLSHLHWLQLLLQLLPVLSQLLLVLCWLQS